MSPELFQSHGSGSSSAPLVDLATAVCRFERDSGCLHSQVTRKSFPPPFPFLKITIFVRVYQQTELERREKSSTSDPEVFRPRENLALPEPGHGRGGYIFKSGLKNYKECSQLLGLFSKRVAYQDALVVGFPGAIKLALALACPMIPGI